MIKPWDPDSLVGIAESRPFVLHTRVVTGTGGGPEKTILNSPRYLARYGIDCACLFMRPPGDPGFATLERKAETAGAEKSSASTIAVRLTGALSATAFASVANETSTSGTHMITRATRWGYWCDDFITCIWSQRLTAGFDSRRRRRCTTRSIASA